MQIFHHVHVLHKLGRLGRWLHFRFIPVILVCFCFLFTDPVQNSLGDFENGNRSRQLSTQIKLCLFLRMQFFDFTEDGIRWDCFCRSFRIV